RGDEGPVAEWTRPLRSLARTFAAPVVPGGVTLESAPCARDATSPSARPGCSRTGRWPVALGELRGRRRSGVRVHPHIRMPRAAPRRRGPALQRVGPVLAPGLDALPRPGARLRRGAPPRSRRRVAGTGAATPP